MSGSESLDDSIRKAFWQDPNTVIKATENEECAYLAVCQYFMKIARKSRLFGQLTTCWRESPSRGRFFVSFSNTIFSSPPSLLWTVSVTVWWRVPLLFDSDIPMAKTGDRSSWCRVGDSSRVDFDEILLVSTWPMSAVTLLRFVFFSLAFDREIVRNCRHSYNFTKRKRQYYFNFATVHKTND